MNTTTDISFRPSQSDASKSYAFDLFKRTAKDNVVAIKGHWCDESEEQTFMAGFSGEGAYIIEYNNEIVGCFCLKEQDNSYMLQRMYVEPSMQGMGLGSKILEHAKNVASKNGKFLDLEVLFTNKKAFSIYKKKGFEVIYKKPLGYGMRLKTITTH